MRTDTLPDVAEPPPPLLRPYEEAVAILAKRGCAPSRIFEDAYGGGYVVGTTVTDNGRPLSIYRTFDWATRPERKGTAS